MKTLLKTLFLTLLLGCCGFGYAQQVQYPATGIITVPRWESPGIPDGWVAPQSTGIIERGAVMPYDIRPKGQGPSTQSNDPDASARQDGNLPLDGSKVAQGSVVSVGRHFVANSLTRFTPCDNAMAISDSGFIVSADNYTIEYYQETTDSLVQHQRHHTFYGDTALFEVPFDPRVIYDRYSQRFILITLAYKDSAANEILLSVSKGQDPRNGWHQYRINSDTLDNNQWLDFANLAVNKNELVISGNMFDDAGDVFSGVKMFQLRKREILAGLPLAMRVWPDVMDDDGNPAYTLVPLSHGLMSDSYDRGMYLVSTKLVMGVQSSNKLYWYHLTDSLDAPAVTITTNQSASSIAYSPQNAALQLGNGDLIRISDCRVQSGYVLDSTLNFVYTKNTNGFSTIALHRLDIRTNTNDRFAWGFSSGAQDYCFPSIAFWGADTTDSDNILMCFQRTGSGIFPELAVINFQGGAFAPTATLVRAGDGFIDLTGGDTPERWGDYTTIQRRYGAPQKACWLAGSYPNGQTANFYGRKDCLNSYVAEIVDSIVVATEPMLLNRHRLHVFPNPTSGSVTISLDEESKESRLEAVYVINFAGLIVLEKTASANNDFQIDLGGFPKGAYVLKVTHKNGDYETRKVILY